MTDWESLGGSTDSDVSVVSTGVGKLDLFVRGGGKAIYHKWFNGSWGPSATDWQSIGGTAAAGVTAVSSGGGQLNVFVAGEDNVINVWR